MMSSAVSLTSTNPSHLYDHMQSLDLNHQLSSPVDANNVQPPKYQECNSISNRGHRSDTKADDCRLLMDSCAQLDSTNVIRIAWQNVNVALSCSRHGGYGVNISNRRKQKLVLEDATGYAEPGSLLAIMGPSGSGKSSLLDTLSGRLGRSLKQTGGCIWINGHQQTPSLCISAYVTQDDTLIGTLTVMEMLWYSANLRLPKASPSARTNPGAQMCNATNYGDCNTSVEDVVRSTMIEMGLEECANTPIGNWHLRGLSGGEKRRLSIAIEILTRPQLLFLDEPTSGLDSASAFFVVKTLRKLAQGGRTILASIHQPSSEVFEIFDYLFLLSNGKTVYFGETIGACEHFACSGFPCPRLRNPSDHFLRAINADFDRATTHKGISTKEETLDASYDVFFSSATQTEFVDAATAISILTRNYKNSDISSRVAQRVKEIAEMKTKLKVDNGVCFTGSQARLWTQVYMLIHRSSTNMCRDMGYYWLRLTIYAIVSLCIGTIYYHVGTTYTSIMARASCMSFISGFLTFMAIGGFPSFVEEMKIFSREHLNGHYGVMAFVIGNSVASLPFLFLISLSSASVCYFMVGLHSGFSHFVYFLLCLFAGLVVVESLMMAIASFVPNYLMGIITGAGIQGIFLLVAGFFRLPNDLPKPFWKYPLFYVSFHSYSLQGMYKNEFLGLNFNVSQSAFGFGNDEASLVLEPTFTISGQFILGEVFEIPVAGPGSRSKWCDLAILLMMSLAYRLIFFIIIKLQERPFTILLASNFHCWRRRISTVATKLAIWARLQS